MKKSKKTIFFAIAKTLAASTMVLSAVTASAQETYTLLQPLITPSGEVGEVGSDLGEYLNLIFMVVLGVIGVLAVIKIVLGGLQYMSTDAISGKSEGKHAIQSAVGGLLLAIIAWIILYTINPEILGLNLFSQ